MNYASYMNCYYIRSDVKRLAYISFYDIRSDVKYISYYLVLD